MIQASALGEQFPQQVSGLPIGQLGGKLGLQISQLRAHAIAKQVRNRRDARPILACTATLKAPRLHRKCAQHRVKPPLPVVFERPVFTTGWASSCRFTVLLHLFVDHYSLQPRHDALGLGQRETHIAGGFTSILILSNQFFGGRGPVLSPPFNSYCEVHTGSRSSATTSQAPHPLQRQPPPPPPFLRSFIKETRNSRKDKIGLTVALHITSSDGNNAN